MTTALLDDLVQPFQVEASALRGRLVRLGALVDTIVAQHAYPEPVAGMLGEAIALATILAGALKYDGIFTLQTKGDGPIRLIVVDVTTAGAVRGYAQFDAEKLEHALAAAAAGGPPVAGSVPRLLGGGYIAFTVDQGEHTERYQGIVELQGASLAECAHHYFRQSEQIRAGIKLAVGRDPSGAWRAGGIMLQRLPEEGSIIDETRDDGWRRALILMSSTRSDELLDARTNPHELLFRLFHEDGVRVFAPHDLEPRCRCSRHRIERILRAMPAEDVSALLAGDDRVEVVCEFCNARYAFAMGEIAALRAG
ncbi:MAG TPA: Hsp33 family molecular chaperone HslO [Stellaceae bacterium]|nr:Hsp33 family molecular chaperone HslO [Stellaceae bacterium]